MDIMVGDISVIITCVYYIGKLVVATRVDYGIYCLCMGSENRILIGGGDGCIHIFSIVNNVFTEQSKVQYSGDGKRIAITAMKYSNNRLVCCASDGSMKCWEML